MELLAKSAAQIGIQLSAKQLEKFQIYADELIEWNQRFNLTAIDERDLVQLKHFLDSLAVLTVWQPRENERLIDVGAGAGFPGIPLKILHPEIRLTLLEATAKKVTFLEHIIERLGLTYIRALHGRAEELGQEAQHREQYDLVLARAVATLPELLEYTLPFARLGGRLIAHKGAAAHQEVVDAEMALSVLGGKLERVVPLELPGITEVRQLIVVKKVARTPSTYPRRPGLPHKRPLGAPAEDGPARHH